MIRLAEVRDDHDAVRMELFRAIKRGCKIGGGVVARAVGFANQERLGLETRVLAMEHHERAFAHFRDVGLREFAINPLDLVIIKALAEAVVERDSKSIVDLLKRLETDVGELFPKRDVLRIAGLQ